jgi:hypothetical protein
MTSREKKQATFLVVLLGILGLTLYLAPAINRAPAVSGAQTTEAVPESTPSAVNDARIRVDLIDRHAGGLHAGDENLFQYRVPQGGSTSVIRPGMPSGNNAPPPPPPTFTPPPSVPQGPPPPPPVPFSYRGFARSESGSGELTAFLSDDRGRYNVKIGEVLMGRFRISAITDSSVEVEDLQFNRRQTLPLVR